MDQPLEVANPFVLMTSPETIFAAIERSERLSRLKSTICRPLDKPRPDPSAPVDARAAFDAAVDSSEVEPAESDASLDL